MKYVYVLQSLSHPDKHYTGITDNVEKRLELHRFELAKGCDLGCEFDKRGGL